MASFHAQLDWNKVSIVLLRHHLKVIFTTLQSWWDYFLRDSLQYIL